MWMLSFGEGLKSPKISNVNKNRRCGKKQKVPLFFFKCIFLSCKVFLYSFLELHARNKHLKKEKGYFLVFVTPIPLIFSTT